MKRRATSLLFAVVTGVPAAVIATPTTEAAVAMEDTVIPAAVLPIAVPRVLSSGAPACGNVAIWKLSAWPEPECKQFHDDATVVAGSVIEQAREIGSVLAVFDGFGDGPLTLEQGRRPGS